MKLLIKTLQNKNIALDISETDDVASIKNKLNENHNVGAPELQKLIYKGHILKDEQNIIKDFNAKENDLVVLIVNKAPIPKKRPSTPPSAVPPVVASQFRTISAQESPACQPGPSPQIVRRFQRTEIRRENPGGPITSIRFTSNNPVALPMQQDHFDQHVSNLVNMGYSRENSVMAMIISNFNEQSAAEFLAAQRTSEASNASAENPLTAAQGHNLHPSLFENILRNPPHGAPQEIPPAQGGDGRFVLALSASDHEAIGRLSDLGFPWEECTQMYFACDRNEEAAADLLCQEALDHDDEEDSFEQQGPPHRP